MTEIWALVIGWCTAREAGVYVCDITGTRVLVCGLGRAAERDGVYVYVREMIATAALVGDPSTVDRSSESGDDEGCGNEPARDAGRSGLVESASNRGWQRATAGG
jgi:hypothetical protein